MTHRMNPSSRVIAVGTGNSFMLAIVNSGKAFASPVGAADGVGTAGAAGVGLAAAAFLGSLTMRY